MTTAADEDRNCGPKRCACLLHFAILAAVKLFTDLNKLTVDLILDPCLGSMIPRPAFCQCLLASAKPLQAVRRERVETHEDVVADAEALVVYVAADEFASWHGGGCREEGDGEGVHHLDLGLLVCLLFFN